METMIYLDTHVVAWLYAGESARLSQTAIRQICDNDLLVSPMVRLELRYLYEIGKTKTTPQEVISELEQQIGLELCQHPFAAIIHKAESLTWTRDPFDRIIVGQAALHNDTLVTKDETILSHYEKATW